MAKADIGIVGMSTMGSNLALNVERNGYVVAVFNRTAQRTKQFVDTRARDKNIMPAYSLEEFVELLKVPKRILLMVKAGKPVDDFIQKLVPLLEKGSIIIDGGNSHYMDTERRCKLLEDKGIRFLGAGISGGEKGALYGPSIMVGGSHEAYDEIAELLDVISARTEDGSCCAYLGKGGAGHFVKMTHNGIEYAIMQIISEAYDLLRTVAGMEVSEIQQIFEQWNEGRLNSFLMEITAKLLRKIDDETGKPLVELILDKAGSKGTGKWTVQSALDLGVAVPSIVASVNARILSDYKEQRVKLVKKYGEFLRKIGVDRYIFRNVLEEAVYVAALVAYAQGLHLISVASVNFGYNTNISEVVRIWKGGCIIRSTVLNLLRKAYLSDPTLEHLFFYPEFMNEVKKGVDSLKDVIITAVNAGIPLPVMGETLFYIYSLLRERLPANVIQAQRDFFGAHTFQRVDKEGIFHEEWE